MEFQILSNALESLKKCHHDTFKIELIVIDNGSWDESVKTLSQFKDIILIENGKKLWLRSRQQHWD